MNLGLGSTLLPGDPRLIDHIVGEVKSQGIFDQFRKECIADVDTKPAYQNLRTRVESSVNSFLSKQRWRADLNKNQLRETLRKHISDGPYLDTGVERIVDQVVNPKIYSVFMPQVEDVVHEFLGLEKPKREKNGACGFKDLLPKDLDPVSPESDKNSLKDISLDSVDANLTIPGEERDQSIKREPEESEVKVEVKTEDFSHLENDFSNGKMEDTERSMGEPMDLEGNTPPHPGLNDSVQSEEKEEEEEDSPVFEPIDIMNLNESNISNDSHLSGISELTSHRSRSPDFSNDFSRDNFDFSNQDSQLSKVSSDSRLSIVTDFGSSNQPTTPVPDLSKDENSKDKFSKDNFKEIREACDDPKDNKIDGNKQKENLLEMKDGSDTRSSKTNLSSKDSSRDGTESVKEKSEHKSKEKIRESGKSKSSKERSDSRESSSRRDREKDKKKSSHESKTESSEKSRSRDKSETSRDSADKLNEAKDNRDAKESKDTPIKLKEEKPKESPNKEGKDLKDIYKEKIRELREKKELTEKEKLSRDNKEGKETSKDVKSSKDSKEKRDSPKDKEKHRSSSSRTHSSSRHESRSSKSSRDDSKSSKNDRDKTKRDDSHRSKDGRSKTESESNEKSDKSDLKKSSKPEKDEKLESKDSKDSRSSQKSTRKDSKSDSKGSERSEKRDDKEGKEKRRKEEKKSKSKDDHSSLRKGSNDRRSSDRDGSSGSSGRGSQKSSSSPNTSSSKPSSSSLGKDSSTNSNASSETSDGIDETQTEEFKPSELEVPAIRESKVQIEETKHEIELKNFAITERKTEIEREKSDIEKKKPEIEEKKSNVEEPENPIIAKRIDPGQSEISLPLKKRPLQSEDLSSRPHELPIKKPKFARNFAEAKKLMKIRKQMEKETSRGRSSVDNRSPASELSEASETEAEISCSVPDEERVQTIEVKADDEDEPYSKPKRDLSLEESTKIILTGDEILNTAVVADLKTKSTLSEMELSIRQSLTELISDKVHENSEKSVENVSNPEETPGTSQSPQLSTDSTIENIELKPKVQVTEEIGCREERAEPENSEESISKVSTGPPKEEKPEEKEQKPSSAEVSEIFVTPGTSSKNPALSDDEEECRYFLVDNERLNRFTQFMNSLGLSEDSSDHTAEEQPQKVLESPGTRAMAPPQPKRKYSTSPLSDILLNNSNNNNDGHKLESTIYQEEGQAATKKKKMGRPRKQRGSVNSPSPQMMNGENFVMPMSPESDVSTTSDKNPSSLKDERNRSRGSNQRYTSDDLYKPRPLFGSSSRRSRRSNP